MRNRTCVLLASVLFSLPAAAQDADLLAKFSAHEHPKKAKSVLRYRWFVPELAREPGELATAARFPLVLFLHGAGERGDDNQRQLIWGAKHFVSDAAQAENPCFVLAPQCPRGRWWHQGGQLQLVCDLIDSLAAEHPVDPDRVYITGLSMGGYGTWLTLAEQPERFAAAAPVCGGGKPETAKDFVNVPLWAFHGDADRVVSVEKTREMIAALKEAGGAPRYREMPGVGHNSWTAAYSDRGLHTWMFAQDRGAPGLAAGDRVVFLGDSITQAGVKPLGYIDVFEKDLVTLGDRFDQVKVIGAGISGNRVPDLLDRLDTDVLEQKPDRVVIYIGINDVWHHLNGGGTPKPEFEAGLRELVKRIRASAEPAPFIHLCTPSVIGEQTDGSGELDAMLEEYARVTRKVSREEGVHLIDLHAAFSAYLRVHNPENAKKGILTTDGVHLSEKGNRFLGRIFANRLATRTTNSG